MRLPCLALLTNSACFSPNLRQISTCSEDSTVMVWHVKPQACVIPPSAHASRCGLSASWATRAPSTRCTSRRRATYWPRARATRACASGSLASRFCICTTHGDLLFDCGTQTGDQFCAKKIKRPADCISRFSWRQGESTVFKAHVGSVRSVRFTGDGRYSLRIDSFSCFLSFHFHLSFSPSPTNPAYVFAPAAALHSLASWQSAS